jgi:hypothetical protein
MQRSRKLKAIKELINDINEKKEVHPCQQFFYSNGTDLFKDSQHRFKISENEMDAIAEAERIENNAKQVLKIIIHNYGQDINQL